MSFTLRCINDTLTAPYSTTGTFTSSAIDTYQTSPEFTTIEWSETLPSGTNIEIQLRSASTEAGLTSATWYGPTGTGDYYTTNSGETINSIHDGDQYIQYQATLTTGDTSTTPELSDVTINYGFYNSTTIDSYGRLGIGTAPTSQLTVMGTGTGTDKTLDILDAAGVSNFVILDNGNVGIGTTAPSELLTVYNGSTTGTYTTSGWVHSSDERLKTNIDSIDNALDKVLLLDGVYFNWKNSPNDDKQIGLIAQRTKDIVPEVVAGNDEDGYGISYGNLSALLIEATKEQNNLITTNTNQLSTLDSAINQIALETNINSIKTANLNKYNSLEKSEMEEIEINEEATSNLDNFNQEIGDYNSTDFKEIRINLDNSLDVSEYQTKTAILEFELYLEDADTIEDINTELGNQMDTQELEWIKSNHPYFIDGWNKIEFPLNTAIEHGEIDWTDIKYFRTYFKFNNNNKVGIKNIKLKMYPKPTLAQTTDDIFNLDFSNLDLSDNQDQAEAINIIANQTQDNKSLLTSLSEREGQLEEEMNQLTITVDNINTLATMLTDQVLNHENRITALEEQLSIYSSQIYLPTSMQALNDQFTIYNLSNLETLNEMMTTEELANGEYLFDVDGDLKVDNLVAGKVEIKNEDETNKTIGIGLMKLGQKEVFIETTKVSYNSKVFITSKKVLKYPLSVTIIEPERGFKVETFEFLSEDTEFDWWIVEGE